VVIPPIYDNALRFREGFAVVTQGDLEGYIDKTGNIAIELQYYQANEFNDGLALIMKTNMSRGTFIDKTGSTILTGKIFLVSRYREGLINCADNENWGFIDRKGEFIIPSIYKYASPFYEGKAAVVPKKDINGKANSKSRYGFINMDGEMIIPPLFDGADIKFSEGYCAIWNKGYGYIDTKGEIVIPCDFDYVDHFSEGLAVFQSKGRNKNYGFIDKTGKTVVKPIFTVAEKFEHGLASVIVGKEYEEYRYGYINKEGDYVWEPSR
jgi:hypothetical protein